GAWRSRHGGGGHHPAGRPLAGAGAVAGGPAKPRRERTGGGALDPPRVGAGMAARVTAPGGQGRAGATTDDRGDGDGEQSGEPGGSEVDQVVGAGGGPAEAFVTVVA